MNELERLEGFSREYGDLCNKYDMRISDDTDNKYCFICCQSRRNVELKKFRIRRFIFIRCRVYFCKICGDEYMRKRRYHSMLGVGS